MLIKKRLVVHQRLPQQVLTQSLHAGLLQQGIFAHRDEVIVHGTPREGEVSLGQLALGIGLGEVLFNLPLTFGAFTDIGSAKSTTPIVMQSRQRQVRRRY